MAPHGSTEWGFPACDFAGCCGGKNWLLRGGDWNILLYMFSLGISSSQLTSCHIFQRGRSTTNQIMIDYGYIFISNPTESGGFRYIIHLYPRNGMMIPTDSSICFRGWNHQILSSFVEKLVIYSNWNMLFDGFWCNNGILPDTAWYCMPGIERNSEWIQPIMAFFKIWNMGRTHRIYGNVNQCKPTGF